MKKLGLVFATVVMIMLFAFSVGALESTGQCGNNAYWTFDSSTGELVISGSGALTDWSVDGPTPFESVKTIKKIVIEEGITDLASSMFLDCINVESVVLPESLRDFGFQTFLGCKKLSYIRIPDGVINVGHYTLNDTAFYDNPSNWEDGALYSGKHLIMVNAETMESYVVKEGTLTVAACVSEYSMYSNIKEVILPDSLRGISESAFEGCSNIEYIEIPDNVEHIGENAFSGCENLKSLQIPDKVKKIERGTFSSCVNIEFVSINNNIEVIAEHAFDGCCNLKSIFIPATVKEVEGYAFRGCDALDKVYYGGSQEQWNEIAFGEYNRDLIYSNIIFNHTHSYKAATCTAPETCIGCGNTKGEALEHKFRAATCTTAEICLTCGNTKGKALGHKYTNTCDTTCNTCSATRTITHSYNAATCTKAKTCKVCGATSGSKLGHTYTNACDTTCNRSGCTATRKITHTNKSVTTKATLTKNGKVETKCTVCGYVSKTTTVYYPKTIKLSKTAYTYNGKVQTPSVTVKDSKGNTLKKDTDYTVKYESGRKNPGTYTVTITFKGKYTGTKKLTYTIAPKATTKVTASQTTTTITLKWNKVTGADGYRVYKYNTKTKKYEKLKDVTGTSLKISKLTAGTKYKYKVRAYTKDDGTIWGAYSAVFETATKAKTPTLKVSSSKKGVAALSWSNVSGESGYQVYYSTKKDSGFKKLASYKTNVVKGSKSKLTSGKTYYFKVRAYTKTDNGTVYSAWSSVKNVKVK